MGLPDQKENFTFNHADQQQDPYKVYNYQELQQNFDSRSEEMRVLVNLLITALVSSSADDSGAHAIKCAPIPGLIEGESISLYDVLVALNAKIDAL